MTSGNSNKEYRSIPDLPTYCTTGLPKNTVQQLQQTRDNCLNEHGNLISINRATASQCQTFLRNNQSNTVLNGEQSTNYVGNQYQTWNNNSQHVVTNTDNHPIFFTKTFPEINNIINIGEMNDLNQPLSSNNSLQETIVLPIEDLNCNGQMKKKRTTCKKNSVQPRKRVTPAKKKKNVQEKTNNTKILLKDNLPAEKTNLKYMIKRLKRLKQRYHSTIINYLRSKDRKKSKKIKKLSDKMQKSSTNVNLTNSKKDDITLGSITNIISFEPERQCVNNLKRDDTFSLMEQNNNFSSSDNEKSSIISTKLKITFDQNRNVEAICLVYHRLKPSLTKTGVIVNGQQYYDKNENEDEHNLTLLVKAVELLEKSESANNSLYCLSLTGKAV
ncbi:unnamed protein product [Didymodactylos carnosus]|nr:unnamed protein product [Didymodactylos carnosus]CAF3977868.1 unnamed protein product [Didymodactylos carnosus]